MITTPSPLRRTYEAVAMFSVLNVAALLGLIGYLMATKTVTGDRLRSMIEYMRLAEQPAEEAGASAPVPTGAEAGGQETASFPIGPTAEIMRREAVRIKAELDQRLALNNSILLRITTEREAFAREREREAARAEATQEDREKVGFTKQVAIFEALAPKVAVQHLLNTSDVQEAARMLLAIDTRRAKKIVEAAKDPEDAKKMRAILAALKDVAPDKSGELQGDG